ncbi:hypothetical protein V6N13_049926 [Hibiscus sabdariffa]
MLRRFCNHTSVEVAVALPEALAVQIKFQSKLNSCSCHSRASRAIGMTIRYRRNKSTKLISVASFFCCGSIFDAVLHQMHRYVVVLSIINLDLVLIWLYS